MSSTALVRVFSPVWEPLLRCREDTHPPFYYFLLWIWGQLIGQSPVTLRLLSWFAYCLGGVVMVRQSIAIGGRNMQVLTVAGLVCVLQSLSGAFRH